MITQVRTKLQNVHKKELEDLSKWIKVWCCLTKQNIIKIIQ